MKHLVVLSLLLLSACVTAPATQRFSGDLDWSFETSSFHTDDGKGPYWLSADGDVWPQVVAPIERLGHGPYGRVHLVIDGQLSEPGHYGQLGAYEHELHVTRVIGATLVQTQPQGS